MKRLSLALFMMMTTFKVAAGPLAIDARSYRIDSFSSDYACRQAKARSPSAVCQPHVTKLPENIIFKVSEDAKGQHFLASSDCKTMKGDIVQGKDCAFKMKETSMSDSSKCAGQALSLYHDAAFTRLLEVTRVNALPKSDALELPTQAGTSLILRPIDANVAVATMPAANR